VQKGRAEERADFYLPYSQGAGYERKDRTSGLMKRMRCERGVHVCGTRKKESREEGQKAER
jgi:ribosomal protein L34